MTDTKLRAEQRDPVAAGLAVATLIAAAAIRLVFPPDPNIGWLTSVARAVRDGARLGRDIVETNPPMAVWLQTPAAVAERLTGWPAEGLQTWLVFLLGLAVAEHLARRLVVLGGATRFDRALLYAVLLALPLGAFAEREHVALLLVVPAVALAMARAAGRAVETEEILLAGLAAALAAMVKPHFALPTLLLAVFLCARRRSALPLFLPEFIVAAAATLAYAAAVVLFVPAYVADVLPVVFDVYRPVKHGAVALFTSGEAIGWAVALAALAVLTGRRLAAPTIAPLVAASLGFFVAFAEQGRFWPYHAFPALALLALALARAAADALTGDDARRRIVAVAGLLALAVPLPNLGLIPRADADLVAAIAAARPRPTLLALSADLTPGHPITTETGGRWVGTHSSRWITVYADLRKRQTDDEAIRARCDAWIAFDRAAANRDLAERRPDIVLVGTGGRDWHAWIAADPETARLMSAYRLLHRQPIAAGDENRFEAVEAWIRSDLVTAAR